MKISSFAVAAAVIAAIAFKPLALRHGSAADAQVSGARAIDPKIVPPTVIGMNLGAIYYTSAEQSFADPIKVHGALYLAGPGGGWLTDKLDFPLQQDGGDRPIDVPAGKKFLTSLQDGEGPPIVGTFACEIAPGWTVDISQTGTLSQHDTHFTVTVPSHYTSKTVKLGLTAAKDGASLSKLSCRSTNLPADAYFRPDFLADMKPFRVIRFMDWMKTNNLPHQSWADRPKPTDFSPYVKGVPVEDMVRLANTLSADPWFTLPFDADADYYRNFAIYVRDHLAPGLHAYVELSNEVWNTGFDQAKQAALLGKSRYRASDEGEAADFYYADRVRDMMAIWTEVFAGQKQRLVRVLAEQAWPVRADRALGHKDTWRSVDALAIAPYWGDVPNDIPGTGQARVDGILRATPGYIDQAITRARESKQVASRYGLRFVSYEGGPAYNAFDPVMRKDVEAVLKDPRLYGLYTGFLQRWRKEVGGLLVLYDSAGTGYFSHKDYTGQPLSEAPKMRAVVDFIGGLPPANTAAIGR